MAGTLPSEVLALLLSRPEHRLVGKRWQDAYDDKDAQELTFHGDDPRGPGATATRVLHALRGRGDVRSLTLRARDLEAQAALRDAFKSCAEILPRLRTLRVLGVAAAHLTLQQRALGASLTELVVRSSPVPSQRRQRDEAARWECAGDWYDPTCPCSRCASTAHYKTDVGLEIDAAVRLPSLRVLELRARTIEGLEDLLAGCPALEVLCVGTVDFRASLQLGCAVMAKLPATLRELSIEGVTLTDPTALQQLAARCPALRTLRLATINGRPQSLDALPTAALERLSICVVPCLDNMPAVFARLRDATRLRELVLKTGRGCDVRLDALVGSALQSSLQTFVCHAETHDAARLVQRFLSGCTSLVHVATNFQCDFECHAASAATLQSVTYSPLASSAHNVAPNEAPPPSNNATTFPALRTLRMLQQPGRWPLARLAAACPALQQIVLLGCHEDGDASFAWPELQHLQLQGQGPTSLRLAASSLCGHASLRVLKLDRVCVPGGVQLRDLPALRTLELANVHELVRLELNLPLLQDLAIKDCCDLEDVAIYMSKPASVVCCTIGNRTKLRFTGTSCVEHLAVVQGSRRALNLSAVLAEQRRV